MPLVDDIEMLILYASIGSGHRTAAEAIAQQAADVGGAGLRVRLVDLLTLTDVGMTDRLSSVPSATGISSAYDAVWGADWLSAPVGGTLRALRPLLFPRLRAQISPDTRVVVSTHALGAILTADLLRAWRVAVLTDFMPHGFWPRQVDRICVPTQDARVELELRGFPASTIELTGVPVREQFAHAPSREAARVTLGIDGDRRVALVVAGARDPGPYAQLAQRIPAVVSALVGSGMLSVVLTGTNTPLAEQLAAEFGESVRVVPYTDDVATLIAASDVVVAKPGGSIVSESIACGRPLILLSRGSGQERANSAYLEKAGAAIVAENDDRLRDALAGSLSTASQQLMAAEKIAMPGAARHVARVALEPFEPRAD